jgi:hypothetical protein
MRSDLDKRKSDYDYEHLYHKPHFGPEQTDLSILEDVQRYKSNKNLMRKSLNDQIKSNTKMRSMSNFQERHDDMQNLKVAKMTFNWESMA